jgi:8-oxo-dGTP diphosphatase
MAHTHSAPTHTTIDVVCLVALGPENTMLATQRAADKPLALLWEFPGGKIDPGESAETALRREIHEELGIEFGALTEQPAVTHTYDFGTIRLIPFTAYFETQPTFPHLTAHAATQWIALNDWKQLQWAPADLPIIERLLKSDLSK